MASSHAQLRRLYWIDAAIQRLEYPNATALAAELAVSPGTIRRDIQMLRTQYRAPVTYDPSQGGYSYGHRARPELPNLPAEEAIELARVLFRRGEIGASALGECLLSLLRQLSQLLPDDQIKPVGERAKPHLRHHPAKQADPVTLHLRFDAAVVREVLDAGIFTRSEVQLLTTGGCEATVHTADPDALLLGLLQWAPHFEIAGPPWARRRLQQLLRRLLKQMQPRK